ncbi:MAG TPA: class I SAM-dependent methyltransferase [Thermomicrobiales bacterium]|nr:class I SAM-dependent methyltransferase [Thermomicrobiales bacterium]
MNEATTTPDAGSSRRDTLLGNTPEETARLIRQSALFRPMTRRLFVEAGIAEGMRVLDLGSGAGDVALLAAELVGRDGEVIGIERDPSIIAIARGRAAVAGLTNVTYVEGDITTYVPDGTFDALVGRLVLMYQPDPAAVVRRFLPMLRPGAIVAFHEADFQTFVSEPPSELLTRVVGWWLETLRRANIEQRMGPRLYETLIQAGLPEPAMIMEAVIGGGDESPVPTMLADVIRSVLPVMVRAGVVTEAEVDIDTLADRLRAEAVAGRGCVSSPALVGAWTRVP